MKNILLVVMARILYVLMISLVSFLKHTYEKNTVYSFINSMIKESKYCSDVIKKPFKQIICDDYRRQ